MTFSRPGQMPYLPAKVKTNQCIRPVIPSTEFYENPADKLTNGTENITSLAEVQIDRQPYTFTPTGLQNGSLVTV